MTDETTEQVATRRRALLVSLTSELQTLERMNPKASLRDLEVWVFAGKKKVDGFSLGAFLGYLCADAVLAHGTLWEAERVEVHVR